MPDHLNRIRDAALRAISPIKAADSETQASADFLFKAQRTKAGQDLPPYYLVYFLLVDLLGFQNLGRWEKLAWSIPIDYNGQAFVIEHRKMGLGVFAADAARDETTAVEIVKRIKKAVQVGRPFFDWLATNAVASSNVNVQNKSSGLFGRYHFLRHLHRAKVDEAEQRQDEQIVENSGETAGGGKWQTVSFPAIQLRTHADYLALSAVEAFFSWTEHVLILVSILNGRTLTAEDVASLAAAEWSEKFKAVFDLSDTNAKRVFDRLMAVRRELRNFVAHGAFGKDGEAFMFHSAAGAVPVLLPHKAATRQFTFGDGLRFNVATTLAALDEFEVLLWDDARAPAKIYLQDGSLPVILTYAADGTYRTAMSSVESMTEFMDQLIYQMDNASNMDW